MSVQMNINDSQSSGMETLPLIHSAVRFYWPERKLISTSRLLCFIRQTGIA